MSESSFSQDSEIVFFLSIFKSFSLIIRYNQSIGRINYYIFHVKPHFLKTLFQSRLMFDFDDFFITGHNFESILPKDHPCHVCFKTSKNNFFLYMHEWLLQMKNKSLEIVQWSRSRFKMVAVSRHSFNIEPFGKIV
jgi:hypothetical protein